MSRISGKLRRALCMAMAAVLIVNMSWLSAVAQVTAEGEETAGETQASVEVGETDRDGDPAADPGPAGEQPNDPPAGEGDAAPGEDRDRQKDEEDDGDGQEVAPPPGETDPDEAEPPVPALPQGNLFGGQAATGQADPLFAPAAGEVQRGNVSMLLGTNAPGGVADTGNAVTLTLSLMFAGVHEDNASFENTRAVLKLPKPLELVEVYASSLLLDSNPVMDADSDPDYNLVALDFVTFDRDSVPSASQLVEFRLRVRFPNLTTPDGAGGEIVAAFYQDGDNLSDPAGGEALVPAAAAPLRAAATANWTPDKQLGTSTVLPGSGGYGAEAAYRLLSSGGVLVPDKTVNYLLLFDNEQTTTSSGVMATTALRFEDSFRLPDGVSLPNGADDIRLTDLAAGTGHSLAYEVTAEQGGVYRITGEWTNETPAAQDLPQLALRVNLLNLTVDSAVFAGSADWTPDGATYWAQMVNTLDAAYDHVGGDDLPLARRTATAILYNGSTPPGGGEEPSGADIGIHKSIGDAGTVLYPDDSWETRRDKTFTLGGFHNEDVWRDGVLVRPAFERLEDFTLTDRFDSRMTPISMRVGEYAGYSGPLVLRIHRKSGGYFERVYQSPANQTTGFTGDTVLPEDVDYIELLFGEVEAGFAVTTPPTVRMRTGIPDTVQGSWSTGLNTLTNTVTLTARTGTGAEVVRGDSASYQVQVGPGLQVGAGKSVDKDVATQGDVLTYNIFVTNSSAVPIRDPRIVDHLPWDEVGGKQYLEDFAVVGYYAGTVGELGTANDFTRVPVSSGLNGVTITTSPADPAAVFDSVPPEITWDFTGLELAPGETLVVRFQARVRADVPHETTLTNTYDFYYRYGIGEEGGKQNPDGGVSSKVRSPLPTLSVLKATDKTASGGSFVPAIAGGRIRVFETPFALADADLPASYDNSFSDRVPAYSQGEDVTFTILVKNEQAGLGETMGRYMVRDNLFVELDKDGATPAPGEKDLEQYFVFEGGQLAVKDIRVSVVSAGGAVKYSNTVTNVREFNDFFIPWNHLPGLRVFRQDSDEVFALFFYFVSGVSVPALEAGDQYQIQYTVTLKREIDEAVRLPVRLENHAGAVYPDFEGDNLFYREVNGTLNNPRFASSIVAYDSDYNNMVTNYAPFQIKSPEPPRIGIAKEAVYLEAGGYPDLRVLDGDGRGADNALWLRRAGVADQGGYLTYKITLTNRSGYDLGAGSLGLADLLPEGQRLADWNANPATSAAASVYYYTDGGATLNALTNGVTLTAAGTQVNFTNPTAIPDGGSAEIYLRTVVQDVDALSAQLAADYPDRTWYPFDNLVLLRLDGVLEGADPIERLGKPLTNEEALDRGFAGIGDAARYLLAEADIYYQKDEITPGIAKSVLRNDILPTEHSEFTIEVTNTSMRPMSGFTVVDLLDETFVMDAGPSVSFALNGVPLAAPPATALTGPVNGYYIMEWTFPESLSGDDLLTIRYEAKGLRAQVGIFRNYALLLPGQDFIAWGRGAYLDEQALGETNDYNLSEGLRENIGAYIGSDGQPHDAGVLAEAMVTATSVSGLVTRKGVRPAGSTGSYTYNTGDSLSAQIVRSPGDEVEYILEIENVGDLEFRDIRILDILPHRGDTGLYVQNDQRGSRFALTLSGDDPIVEVLLNGAPVGSYEARYGNTRTANATDAWTDLAGATAAPGDNALVLSVPGAVLQNGDLLTVALRAKLPEPGIVTDRDDAENMDGVAWNSFSTKLAASGVERQTEPLRVGVRADVGSLTILKRLPDAAQSLQGFEFTIRETGTGRRATAVSDSAGEVYFGNLIPGREYTVTESGRAGYAFSHWVLDGQTDNAASLTFTLPGGDPDLLVYAHNDSVEPNTIYIRKLGPNGETLRGAVFTLQRPDLTTETLSFTGDRVSVTLPAAGYEGAYVLTETSAPAGYLLNATPIRFEVLADGTIRLSAAYGHVQVSGDALGLLVYNDRETGGNGGGGGGGGGSGGGNGGESGGNRDTGSISTVTIPDDPVPLGELPGMTEILDEEVPLGTLPRTGVTGSLTGAWIVMAAAAAGIVVAARRRR